MLSINDPVAYYNPFGFSPIVKIRDSHFCQYCGSIADEEHCMAHHGENDFDYIKHSCDCAGWYTYKEAWKSHCALKNEVVPKIKALYDELGKKHPRLSENEILCQSEIKYIKKKYGV